MSVTSVTKEKKIRLSASERRAGIVAVASGLFARKGFSGTTTREIAEKADISEATIFKHFAKKEDLYHAIIDDLCSDDSGKFIMIERIKGMDGRDAFFEVARHLLELHSKDTTLPRLIMYSALEGQDFSEIFLRSRGMEMLECLSGLIKGLVEEGRFEDVDSELSARAFLGMIVHYSISQEIYGFKKHFKRSIDEAAKRFVDIFFDGMTARGMTTKKTKKES